MLLLRMYWGTKKIAGTVYDLSHLDPFVITCPRGDKEPYRVRVIFGSHVFTEGAKEYHTPDLIIKDGNSSRAFCLQRWAHSLHIKAAVGRAIEGVVYNDAGRAAISARLPGLAGPYLIAFKVHVQKTGNFDCVMTVVSAHHRPDLNETLPSAKFTAVIGATMAGAKIRWKKPEPDTEIASAEAISGSP